MRTSNRFFTTVGYLAVCLLPIACEKKFNPADGAAPPPNVIETSNTGVVTFDKPERFSLVTANRVDAPAQLNVTGSVFPDIAREIPVISLANGRVVDINARLDDNVKKGQLAAQGAEPRRHQRIRRLSEGRQRRADGQQGLHRAPRISMSTAPFRRPCLSRLRTPKKDAKADPDRGRRAIEDPRRGQGPSQPASSMSTRPSPASSSRRTSPTLPRRA